MKYDTKELGEYIEILSGFAFKSKDFTASGVPVIKIKNICPPDVLLNDVSYVSKNFLETHGKYVLNINDILIAMTGSHINQWASVVGRVARVRYQEKSLLNQRVGKIVITDTERCDENFVYYYLSQDFVKIKLANIAGGAANQANISPSDIKRLQFPFPDINTQRRIGKILSSYDDLIENNQKQIKLLEEAAQRLYKEWFVNLRFPNYEKCKIIDGIPEGWKKEKLVDLCDVQYGYAFDGTLFNDKGNGTPIIRIRNIPSGNTGDYTSENADDQYRIQNGEIVVGMDGEFHINSWCGETAYLVQRTCCFRPHDKIIHGWLLWAIFDPIKYFEKTVVGATVSHLGKKHIDTIELLRAPDKMYAPFETYFRKRQLLLNQNRKLTEIRDRLLPKLINGEIEV